MSPHKKIYCDAYGYAEGDTVLCEVTGEPAQDVHAIEADGMGGSKRGHRIENLIALTRSMHEELGDRKCCKYALYKRHRKHMREQGVSFDEIRMLQYIDKWKAHDGKCERGCMNVKTDT